jgi:8-oxo-dGTP diphosphatase
VIAPPVVDVAACIVRSTDGRVLLAQRTARQVAAGYWELPGGKIEPGETPSAAASRELYEEVGLQARALAPWATYDHTFPTKRVRLRFFRVDEWTGTAHGREGQQVAWIDPGAPEIGPILPSNDRVLLAFGLPSYCFVTGPGGSGGSARRLAEFSTALAGGVRLMLVCEPQMAPDQRIAFTRRVVDVARPFGAHVLLAGSLLEARRAGALGVHSTVEELRRSSVRLPVRLWSVSCETPDDLARAVALGADVAMVSSPLRALAPNAPLPLYAHAGDGLVLLPGARQAPAAGLGRGHASEDTVFVRIAS